MDVRLWKIRGNHCITYSYHHDTANGGLGVNKYIEDQLPNAQLDTDVPVRIYCNVRGIGNTLKSHGVLKEAEDLGTSSQMITVYTPSLEMAISN